MKNKVKAKKSKGQINSSTFMKASQKNNVNEHNFSEII